MIPNKPIGMNAPVAVRFAGYGSDCIIVYLTNFTSIEKCTPGSQRVLFAPNQFVAACLLAVNFLAPSDSMAQKVEVRDTSVCWLIVIYVLIHSGGAETECF